MNLHMPIKQVMTPAPVSVEANAPISTVRLLLRHHPFHHLPVTSGGRLVGILSSADLASYALDAWVPDAATADAHLDACFKLESIMTPEPETISPETSVRQAADLLSSGQYHSLPVVDTEQRLLGIVTSTDLLRLLAVG